MAKNATLAIKILGDSRDAQRAMDDMDRKTSGFMGTMGKVGGVAAVAVGAIAGIGVAAFNAASDLEQSTGAIESVFGAHAKTIQAVAEDAVDSVGLSRNAYQEQAATLGAQLKNMGMDTDQAARQSTKMIQWGADLAATFGGPTQDAVDALGSALRGETDPIERYGISIKQADIDARMAAMGMEGLTGEAEKQARTQAMLSMITEQAGGALGAFAREGDTAAGKQQRLSAWWENAQATLGEKLLPAFVAVADFIQANVIPFIDKLTAQGGPLSTMFAEIAEWVTEYVVPAVRDLVTWGVQKLGPMFAAIGRFITTIVVPAFKAVWEIISTYVVPIIKTVLSPIIDGMTTAWNKVSDALSSNSGKFSGLMNAARPVFEFLRDKVAPFIGGALKIGFDVLAGAIGFVVDALGWVVEKVSWLIDKGAAVGEWIGGLFGAPAAPAGGGVVGGPAVFGAAPQLRGAGLFGAGTGGGLGSSGRAGFAGGDVYNITVTGALDPDAVADQIGRMLDRRARRTGARVAA